MPVLGGGSLSTGRESRSRLGLGKDQVQVAKLVPEVATVEGGAVRQVQVRAAGDGRQHVEVRGLGLVETGQQAVHHADTALGRDDEVGPPSGGDDASGGVGGGLQRPHDRCANRDDTAAGHPGCLDSLGSRGWDRERLLIRPLVRLQAGDAGVERQGGEADAGLSETSEQIRRERATG